MESSNLRARPQQVFDARGGGSRQHGGRSLFDRHFGALALAPALIVLATLSLPPTIGALALAFRNDTLSGRHSRWVGLLNFRRMATDHRLLNALEVSLLWEVVTLLGTMAAAILLGILIFERLRGPLREVVCLALILPILLPRVSVGLIWRFLYSPLMGIVNYPIELLHLRPIEFLSQPSVALYAVAIVDIWQWGPFFAVIVYKLIETLPPGPLEAARLDNTTTWSLHWFISLPMLRGALVTMFFIKGVESLRSFDLIYTMTNGGPGIATETLDLYAYQAGIALNGRISYAAAMSVLLLILSIGGFSFLWKRAQRWSA
jgi:multiple sugar transport system permease protein